jgi:hypothetical protein
MVGPAPVTQFGVGEDQRLFKTKSEVIQRPAEPAEMVQTRAAELVGLVEKRGRRLRNRQDHGREVGALSEGRRPRPRRPGRTESLVGETRRDLRLGR